MHVAQSCHKPESYHITLLTRFTRNSSGDEIANVNFLYDDIVHAQQNTIDWCINSATDRRDYVLECRFSKLSEIMQCNGHYLLVINSNLPPTYFVPFPSYAWLLDKFSLAREKCFTLTLTLTCQYRHKWYIAKTRFFGLHFRCRKYLVYLQPLLRNLSRKLPNSDKLRCGYGYYAGQGHPRSPSLVPIESSYATCY